MSYQNKIQPIREHGSFDPLFFWFCRLWEKLLPFRKVLSLWLDLSTLSFHRKCWYMFYGFQLSSVSYLERASLLHLPGKEFFYPPPSSMPRGGGSLIFDLLKIALYVQYIFYQYVHTYIITFCGGGHRFGRYFQISISSRIVAV